MKKSLVLITVLLFVTHTSFAGTTYCTTKNWDKTARYFKKYEGKLNDRIYRYNDLLHTKENMGFYSNSYRPLDLAILWISDETAVKLSVNDKTNIIKGEMRNINTEKVKLEKIKSKLVKAQKNWSTIAESCYDDDEYSNYKAARGNMRDAISHRKYIDTLIVKLDSIQKRYESEIAFFDDTKKEMADYKKECDCN